MKALALTIVTIALISSMSGAQAENAVIFERSYVTHDWGQIHVLTSQPEAPGNLTPLVCFAPNPFSGNYYRMFMEALGSDRTMLALDYPGIGQSDTYPGELDMSTLANIMADSLTSLGWGPYGGGPVDLCGYHTGTMLATELAVTTSRPPFGCVKPRVFSLPRFASAWPEKRKKRGWLRASSSAMLSAVPP